MALTAAQARTRSPGKYRDGHGLLLHVVSAEKRYWVFRYQRDGRERAMSLGSADVVSLAEARRLHTEARALLAKGVDPLTERSRAKAERANRVTFAQAAEAYVEAHKAGWRGRGESNWRQTLADHVAPAFGHKPVHDVDVDDVLRALSPIWLAKTPTAALVRSRIELVLSYAKARGWRDGENPALWRDNLAHLLAKPSKIHRVEHHAALPWAEAPALMATLTADNTMAARSLAFLMLTAARSGEARMATWPEIELDYRVWIVPPERMKAGKQHTVPLSSATLGIVREVALLRRCDLVFEGHTRGRPLRDLTLTATLRKLGYSSCSVHGMRSCFRDWCADTGKQADLAEMSLAHVIGSQVERSYRRSDVLEQRRVLMQQWADYLTRAPAEVIPLRQAG
jgi:integrase